MQRVDRPTFSVIPTEVEESLIVVWPLPYVAAETVRDVSTSLDMINAGLMIIPAIVER